MEGATIAGSLLVIGTALQTFFAFGLTAVLLLLLRRPAIQAGLVDHPCPRKRHGRTVPLIGGICILLGFTAAALPADFGLRDHQALFAGMAMLLIVGVVDDLVEVDAWAKLGFQVLAALLMTLWGGVAVTDLGYILGPGETVDLGSWAVPFTTFCVVGLINAINMLDGVDGLAAGTVAIALGWLTAAGLLAGAPIWPFLSGLLLAAICGFLVFNLRNPWRRKAASFLGDSGSMMLGFALAWFAIQAAGSSTGPLPPIAIGWVLALPVLDTLVLIGRRLAAGRHPFQADREHLHHILYRAGFTPAQTVSTLLLASILLGGVGVLGAFLHVPAWLLATGLIPVAAVHAVAQVHARRSATILRRLLRAARRRLRRSSS